MRVRCDMMETEIENDDGREQEAVVATCARCGHETQSFGTESASRRRCLVLMREGCPRGEANFYVEEE